MGIEIAQSQPVQSFLGSKSASPSSSVATHDTIQILQVLQHRLHGSLRFAHRQLADDEGMYRHLPSVEQDRSVSYSRPAQVVDPHRGIDQGHATFDRRPGAPTFRSGLRTAKSRQAAVRLHAVQGPRAPPRNQALTFSCMPVSLLRPWPSARHQCVTVVRIAVRALSHPSINF